MNTRLSLNGGTMKGTIVTTVADALRVAAGNYGFIIRNDGTNTYFLLTDKGQQITGSWNNFRPITINNETGDVLLCNNSLCVHETECTIYRQLTMNHNIRLNNNGILFDTMSNVYIGNHAIANCIFLGTNDKHVVYNGTSDSYAPYFGGTWTSNGAGIVNLGAPNYKFKDIYASNAAIQTSDKRLKTDISPLKTELITEFILGLNPVSYKMLNGDSGRIHYGLIAQDVENLMDEIGMESTDFAGLIKSPMQESKGEDKPDFEFIYGLRYEEFIAPIIKMLQMQQNEIESLRHSIEEIKLKIST